MDVTHLATPLRAEPCKTGCADSWTHEYIDLFDANGNYLGLMRKETAVIIVGIVAEHYRLKVFVEQLTTDDDGHLAEQAKAALSKYESNE